LEFQERVERGLLADAQFRCDEQTGTGQQQSLFPDPSNVRFKRAFRNSPLASQLTRKENAAEGNKYLLIQSTAESALGLARCRTTTEDVNRSGML
jgi:hypothetical protein